MSLAAYELLSRLGSGGMATVYLARRRGAEQVCVLKVMRQMPGLTEALERRFSREARTACLLEHPNIARIIDAGFDDEQPYMAMELVEGHTLSELYKSYVKERAAVPWAMVLEVALQSLTGLDYAHTLRDEAGAPLRIVHRDLSGRNIMVDERGCVKLIDFGLVKMEGATALTQQGAVVGTLRFLAPEQLRGKAADQRSDLYALSVSLYELITGARLIPKGHPKVIVDKIRNLSPTPLQQRAPEVPEVMAAAIMRGLATTPEARWQNARDYFDALKSAAPDRARLQRELAQLIQTRFAKARQAQQELIEEARVRAEPISQAEKTQTLMVSPQPEPKPLPSGPPRVQRGGLRSTAAVVLVGGAAGLVGLSVVLWLDPPASHEAARPKRIAATEVSPPVVLAKPRPAPPKRILTQRKRTAQPGLPDGPVLPDRPVRSMRSMRSDRPDRPDRPKQTKAPGAQARALVALKADIGRLVAGHGEPVLYRDCAQQILKLAKPLPKARKLEIENQVEVAQIWLKPKPLERAYTLLVSGLNERAQP